MDKDAARAALAALSVRLDDSADLLREVLQAFVAVMEPIHARIRSDSENDSCGCEGCSLEDAARIAHRIANHMGVLGSPTAVAAANRMERAARDGELQAVCDAARALEPLLATMLDAARERLDSGQTAPPTGSDAPTDKR